MAKSPSTAFLAIGLPAVKLPGGWDASWCIELKCDLPLPPCHTYVSRIRN
jgi:hypothetical protein